VVGSDDPAEVLGGMVSEKLYGDIFEHEIIRGKDNLMRLLQALALHIGKEISYNELGAQLGLDKVTVARYVKLFDQLNIVFRLLPYKRRLRKELNRLRKVYFYDLGLRNALIQNFNPLHLRMDTEVLWENYFISEKVKCSRINQRFTTPFFWRTYDGTSLDFLEEEGDRITAYKCSLQSKKWRKPKSFIRAYPNSELYQVTGENYQEFL
jgi:predicted AAA+ superfamily ATPase